MVIVHISLFLELANMYDRLRYLTAFYSFILLSLSSPPLLPPSAERPVTLRRGLAERIDISVITRQLLAERIESQPKAAKSGFHGASDSSVVTIVISCYAKTMAAGPSSSLFRSTFLFVRLTESES